MKVEVDEEAIVQGLCALEGEPTAHAWRSIRSAPAVGPTTPHTHTLTCCTIGRRQGGSLLLHVDARW